jgi:exosome complex exonuclease RRP6
LLEGADRYMDISSGKTTSTLSTTVQQAMTLDKQRLLSVDQVAVENKPQLAYKFLSAIDNTRENPFMPRLKSKFGEEHDVVLQPLRVEVSDDVSGSGDSTTQGPGSYYAHPYEAELRGMEYPAWCAPASSKEVASVNPSPTYAQQAYTLVNSLDKFDAMLQHQTQPGVAEIAVDLEHHNQHTFQGLTCLMQVTIIG